MKTRIGFVSNSSSASFICTNCNKEYSVECRGGVEDEWVPPKEGICDVCAVSHCICVCGKVISKSKSVSAQEYETITATGMVHFSEYACVECFASQKTLEESFEKWCTKTADPYYIPTDLDKKIIEATSTTAFMRLRKGLELFEDQNVDKILKEMEKWGLCKEDLEYLPSNQYHQMTSQIADLLHIKYEQVTVLLDKIRNS